VFSPDHPEWTGLITLDNNPDCKPDWVWDLRNPTPLPFDADTFDEIHAYEVLEHIAQQGDYTAFFRQFSDYWRILKPDGLFFATVPAKDSVWAWGDPSHTRVIQQENLIFLCQKIYSEQVGVTPMSDFRYIYKADFDIAYLDTSDANIFKFVLKAVKPSRIYQEKQDAVREQA